MNDPIREVLQQRFGLHSFRGCQRTVIEHLLGGENALAIMPTGSGKSLLYQVPALLLQGPTLVLSPLIALMKDQVDALRRRGIEATFINSSLSRGERQQRIDGLVSGKYPLVYVTPERFRSAPFREAMEKISVALLAVDEAHCATEWGHDFRPDYSQIHSIRQFLGNPPTVALTATATPAVQQQILQLLGIEDARLFHTGIERHNLFLAATHCIDEEEKWQRLAALQRRLPGAGIVYGALIKDLHRLEDYLAQRQRSLVYHGDLSREERRSMQDEFMQGKETRVLATSAFGMGIDKADIRSILHHQVPGSVEAYYQEIGRAGRDDQPSYCELLYCEQDLTIQTQFIEWANPPAALLQQVVGILQQWGEDRASHDREDLEQTLGLRRHNAGVLDTCLQWLETLGVIEGSLERRNLQVLREFEEDDVPEALGPNKKERDLRRLYDIVQYSRSARCRRAWLNDYFGVEGPEQCQACDVCVDREEWLAANLEQRVESAEVGSLAPAAEGVRRGDFVRVDGRHLGRVLRVSGRGRQQRIEVELTQTLKSRTFSKRKHEIEVLPQGERPTSGPEEPGGEPR